MHATLSLCVPCLHARRTFAASDAERKPHASNVRSAPVLDGILDETDCAAPACRKPRAVQPVEHAEPRTDGSFSLRRVNVVRRPRSTTRSRRIMRVWQTPESFGRCSTSRSTPSNPDARGFFGTNPRRTLRRTYRNVSELYTWMASRSAGGYFEVGDRRVQNPFKTLSSMPDRQWV